MTNPHLFRAPLLALALLLSLLGAALPVLAQSTPVATPPAASVHGIDLAGMDLAVAPEVDFYAFANSGWLDRVVIPADRPAYDVFTALTERTIVQQLDLLRVASGPGGAVRGSDEAKAATLFAQGMDMVERDRQGLEPIRDILDQFGAIDSKDAYHAYLERAPFDSVGATLPLGVLPDLNESTTNALYLGGPSLGLPNRDYYLEDDLSLVTVRDVYVETGAALLAAAGATPVAGIVIELPFTPEQRFFIAAASVWRNKTRPEFPELLVRSDTHASGSVRATQPLRNADAFSAFGIEPGDPMWLAPEERIIIW